MNELYLVRHGETVGDSAIHLYGRTDIALSDTGRRQMRRTADALRETVFDAVFASPLQRSLESARIVMQGREPQPQVRTEFLEIDFGDWEGWSLAQAQERDPGNYRAWKETGADFRFPGGEVKRAFFSRTAHAALNILDNLSGRSLAVLHKGVIKGTLAGLLRRPVDDFVNHRIELGSIHVLEREAGAWRLVDTNRVAHLHDCRLPESG
jgi:broad specificity phosphatase PhoE